MSEPSAERDVAGAAAREPEELDVEALPGGLAAAVEAVLLVAEQPVDELELAQLLQCPAAEVRAVLERLRAELDGLIDADGAPRPEPRPRGVELRRVGGGWRLFSRPELAPAVEAFVLEGQTARLSQAALETLAIVAYRQPIGRSRISAIRGVSVDGVVRTLVARGLIVEQERDAATGAVLYATTPYFLERIGLDSLDELPEISPYLPGAENVDEFTD